MTTLTTTNNATTHATEWVEAYLRAWASNASDDIAALFTDAAEYHENPFETAWIGREQIIAGWRSRWEWQSGGWTFDWEFTSVTDNHAVVTGTGRYTELGEFDNVWTVTFDESGRCSRFDMVNTERAVASTS